MDVQTPSRSEKTRASLLAAAEQVFSEKGLAGARVDEIAQRAGANKRMIYAYFGSKEELYTAVLESVYNRLGQCEEIVTLRSGDMDVVEAIRQIIPAYFRFLSQNDSYVRMVMWENLNMARYFDEKNLGGIRDPMRRAVRQLLARGQEQGVFRRDASEKHLLLTLFGCMFNYFSNMHTMSRVMREDLGSTQALEERARAVTSTMLRDLMGDAYEEKA